MVVRSALSLYAMVRALPLPKSHPCRLSGMPVLVEDSAEAVAPFYVEAAGGGQSRDWWGQWVQWPGVRDSLMRPVGVVELLELAQGVEQVHLVPDQGPVEQLAAAAVEYLASLGSGVGLRERLRNAFQETHARNMTLFTRLWNALSSMPRITLYGPPPDSARTPTLSFTIDGCTSTDAARQLSGKGLFLFHMVLLTLTQLFNAWVLKG